MNEQEFRELSAGYALDALENDERARFEQARAEHPEWEALVADDLEVAADLALATPEVAPPPAMRELLLEQIRADVEETEIHLLATRQHTLIPRMESDTADAGDAFAPADERRGGVKWVRTLFTLAASVALVVWLGFGIQGFLGREVPSPASIALGEIEGAADAQSATVALDDGGEATLRWSVSVGEAVLVTDGLPALDDDQTFELWYVRGDEPIPAGTFDAQSGEATALLAGEMHEGDVIAVTVEPDGGSPDGTPSSDPILAIATAED